MSNIRNISDHPKIRGREKRRSEIEWLKRYHSAHQNSRTLTDEEFDLLHAGMHWLLRTKTVKTLGEAYKQSLSALLP